MIWDLYHGISDLSGHTSLPVPVGLCLRTPFHLWDFCPFACSRLVILLVPPTIVIPYHSFYCLSAIVRAMERYGLVMRASLLLF